jgi:copper(I)-binding protein
VTVLDPWIAKPPQGAPTAAGYLTLRNDGAAPDVFLGARTTAARGIKLHSMTMAGGIMRMRPVDGGLTLPPSKTIVIGPSSGYHLMVIGSKHPLKVGDTLPAVLRFAKAGEIAVTFEVRPLSSRSAAAMPGMEMK